MGVKAQIQLLGVRGTVPVNGEEYRKYGGATSCVLVRMGGEVIVLDAGTGLMDLDRCLCPEDTTLHLLLTHPHADHMFGLLGCPALLGGTHQWHIYARPHGGKKALEQVRALMSEPLWPAGPEILSPWTVFHNLDESSFQIGRVTVSLMEGSHPGGCTVYRLSCDGVSVVFATDFELDGDAAERLREFAQGATLLLCDAQYLDTEYSERRGFGHSNISSVIKLAQACHAGQVRLIHHDPLRTDAELDEALPLLEQILPNASFGRCGEDLWI